MAIELHTLREFSKRESAAIVFVWRYGPRLAKQMPELAQDYREGHSYVQLSERYDVAERYGVTEEIAKGIVACALKILLSSEEREFIKASFASEHKSRGARHAGTKAYRESLGIHAYSEAERRRVSMKALLASGKIPYASRVVEPVTQLNERDYILHLAELEEYQHSTGSKKGRPDSSKIARQVNDIFHMEEGVRKPQSIRYLLHRYRKRG